MSITNDPILVGVAATLLGGSLLALFKQYSRTISLKIIGFSSNQILSPLVHLPHRSDEDPREALNEEWLSDAGELQDWPLFIHAIGTVKTAIIENHRMLQGYNPSVNMVILDRKSISKTNVLIICFQNLIVKSKFSKATLAMAITLIIFSLLLYKYFFSAAPPDTPPTRTDHTEIRLAINETTKEPTQETKLAIINRNIKRMMHKKTLVLGFLTSVVQKYHAANTESKIKSIDPAILKRAKVARQAALQSLSRTYNPIAKSEIQRGIGRTLVINGGASRDPEMLSNAKRAYQAALLSLTGTDNSTAKYEIQLDIGRTLVTNGGPGVEPVILNDAKATYQAALQALDGTDNPIAKPEIHRDIGQLLVIDGGQSSDQAMLSDVKGAYQDSLQALARNDNNTLHFFDTRVVDKYYKKNTYSHGESNPNYREYELYYLYVAMLIITTIVMFNLIRLKQQCGLKRVEL